VGSWLAREEGSGRRRDLGWRRSGGRGRGSRWLHPGGVCWVSMVPFVQHYLDSSGPWLGHVVTRLSTCGTLADVFEQKWCVLRKKVKGMKRVKKMSKMGMLWRTTVGHCHHSCTRVGGRQIHIVDTARHISTLMWRFIWSTLTHRHTRTISSLPTRLGPCIRVQVAS
jgi:hypothetical protein